MKSINASIFLLSIFITSNLGIEVASSQTTLKSKASDRNLNKFINTTCSHINNNDIEDIIRRNYQLKFEPKVDSFLKYFFKYKINNKKIFSKLKEFKPEWQLNKCSLRLGETDAYYENWIMQAHTLKNGQAFFLPTSHFAGMTINETQDKMKRLDKLKIQGRALLLEGFEFHEQIPCQSVLRYALIDKFELVNSEHTFMLHKAFWEGSPIIGADNQRLQQSDYDQMEVGAKEKNDFLYTHKILGRIVSKDRSNSINKERMNKYILESIKISKLNKTVEEYRSFYKILNKRTVPSNSNELYRDLYPVEIQNLGTNRLVERIQEIQRNKALLSAIEFSDKFFGSSLIIYGAYHYGVLRDELLSHSNPYKLPNYCK